MQLIVSIVLVKNYGIVPIYKILSIHLEKKLKSPVKIHVISKGTFNLVNEKVWIDGCLLEFTA